MRMKHVKSGKIYWITAIAVREEDLAPMVIYSGADGMIWTRPASEFFDGRFVVEPVPAAPEVSSAEQLGLFSALKLN